MVVSRAEVTELLHQWSVGRQEVLEPLLPAIYGELKRLAASYLRRERPDLLGLWTNADPDLAELAEARRATARLR